MENGIVRSWRIRLGLLTAASCTAVSVTAQELPSSFTLTRFVPGDVWMVVHTVDNPERAFIQQQWGEVWQAVKNARLDEGIVLGLSNADGEQKQSVKTTFSKIYALIDGVAWGDLVAKETVFAERRARSGVGYDYVFLARGAEGSGAGNFAALAQLMEESAPMLRDAIGLQLVQKRESTNELDVVAVGIQGAEGAKPDFAFHVFRRGDVIGGVVGAHSFDRVRALVTGDGRGRSLATNLRFRSALAEVRTPTDGITFFDMKSFMGDMCSMCDALVVSHKDRPASSAAQKSDVLRRLMAEGDVIDYIVSSQWTEGSRETTQSICRLQSGKQQATLAKAFLDRKTFDRFDRFIPADAVSFSVHTTVDVERIYRLALDFVERELSDGAERKKWIENLPTRIGLNLQEDLFDWLGGEVISVELPGSGGSPMGGSEHVWMLRAKNPELARTKINRLIDFVAGFLQSRGQMLSVTPAQQCPEGFRQIIHPMVAMFMRPVVGVHDEWVIFGTSQQAISRCVAVSEGKAASVRENARFMREGVRPQGPVFAASFSDASNMGENLSQSVAMAGVVGAMVSAQMEGKAPPEAQETVTKLLALGTKLAPVLRELDFFSSRSAMTQYDGGTKVESMSVVTYKTPATLRHHAPNAHPPHGAPPPPPAPKLGPR